MQMKNLLFIMLSFVSLNIATSMFATEVPFRVSEEDRKKEADFLQKFGLSVANVPVLEQPFAMPYTSKSFVVPSHWYQMTDPKSLISVEDLRRDLRHLKDAYFYIYGGLERARLLGFDFEKWFARWDEQLSKGPQQREVIEAFQPFYDLKKAQLDNHSNPLIRQKFLAGSKVYVLGRTPRGGCSKVVSESGEEFKVGMQDQATQPRRAKRLHKGQKADVWYLSWPSDRGLAAWINCDKRIDLRAAEFNVELQQKSISALSGSDSEMPAYRRLSNQVEYLRLPSFTFDTEKRLLELDAKLPADAGKSQKLIIDLRLNDGGNASSSFKILSRWLDLNALSETIEFKSLKKHSCLTKSTWWGSTQLSLRGASIPLHPTRLAAIQGQLDELNKDSEIGCPITQVKTEGSWGYKDHQYKGPNAEGKSISVIVDGMCGSDCEWLVFLLSSRPNVNIIGQNTFGVAQFTQPHYFVLPRTKVAFRLASGLSDLYGDQRSFDGFGFDVDFLLVEQKEWASEDLIKAITGY